MRMTNLAGLSAFRKVVTTSGTPEMLAPNYTAATISFTDNSGTPPTAATKDTIDDSASQFLVEGYEAGDVIVISGSTDNNVECTIYSVTASTITITLSGHLTTEIEGDTVTITLKQGRKVPDGVSVIIKAENDNTGNITIANTSAKALNTNANYDNHFTLAAKDAVTVDIKNLNEVYMDATVSGDGVEILFER